MKLKPVKAGADPREYALGDRDWQGRLRDAPPEISRGSVERFGLLLDPAFGCASIVCSFEEGAEDLSKDKMEAFMDATEKFLLPGVRRQSREMLWIRHIRKNGSVDYHLLIALKYLSSGLSIALLSARRGDLRHLFAYQEWANCHFGFSSPTEPHRMRIDSFVPHRLSAKSKKLFGAVDQPVSRAYEDGLINDRADVVAVISAGGHLVTKEDKYSLTVADASGTKVRLEGFKYQAAFTRESIEMRRAEWNRIHALPQAEREKYLAMICEAARSERAKLLNHITDNLIAELLGVGIPMTVMTGRPASMACQTITPYADQAYDPTSVVSGGANCCTFAALGSV